MSFNWGALLQDAAEFIGKLGIHLGGTSATPAAPATPSPSNFSAASVIAAVKGPLVNELEANNGVLTTSVATAAQTAATSVAGPALGEVVGGVVSALVAKELGTVEAHNQGLLKSST